jgi:ABC-2 type transport system ATP-binding protein
MPAAIEIQGLTKLYGFGSETVKAVDKLELVVEEGEVFGFLGPNGAGKTTTVQMLMQIIFPSSGTARLLGKPLGDIEARTSIGYLPELFQFHDFLKASEFLDFHASLYGMEKSKRRQRVPEVLELVGLDDNANSRIRTFSKGMLQRIGIAQAIINQPRLLFLDEPTSALDPMGRRDVRDLIMRLSEDGTTIFLNSHLLSEVEMTCGRVGILNNGSLVRVSEMQALITPTPCVDVKVDRMTDEMLARIEALATSVEKTDDHWTVFLKSDNQVNDLADIIMDSGVSLREFTPRQKPLEEVFIQAIEDSEQ